jgi:imidazolonepropionase-like amidohydrolase
MGFTGFAASSYGQNYAIANVRILADEIGTLAPGKKADIVLVEGDPLENIHALQNIKLVLKEGRIVADHR